MTRRRLYRGRDLRRAQNIAELRAMAAARVPDFCFEYLEGGADDELSLRRNRSSYDAIGFLPRTLIDVSVRPGLRAVRRLVAAQTDHQRHPVARGRTPCQVPGRRWAGRHQPWRAATGWLRRADIREAVGPGMTLIVDSGLRRGGDFVKARALGADAAMSGRATLYGLAAGGKPGAARALEIIRTEIDRSLGLLGCPNLVALSREHVRVPVW